MCNDRKSAEAGTALRRGVELAIQQLAKLKPSACSSYTVPSNWLKAKNATVEIIVPSTGILGWIVLIS